MFHDPGNTPRSAEINARNAVSQPAASRAFPCRRHPARNRATPALTRYWWERAAGRRREPGPEQDDQGDRGRQAGQRDGFAGRGGGDAVGLQRARVHQRAGGRPERGEVDDEEGGQDDVRRQPEPDPRPEGGQQPAGRAGRSCRATTPAPRTARRARSSARPAPPTPVQRRRRVSPRVRRGAGALVIVLCALSNVGAFSSTLVVAARCCEGFGRSRMLAHHGRDRFTGQRQRAPVPGGKPVRAPMPPDRGGRGLPCSAATATDERAHLTDLDARLICENPSIILYRPNSSAR